jgi:hypothetical protein
MTDIEKAYQSWKIESFKSDDPNIFMFGVQSFKSSLKRKIEKRIAEHRKYYRLFSRIEDDAHIQECQHLLELLNTVEP